MLDVCLCFGCGGVGGGVGGVGGGACRGHGPASGWGGGVLRYVCVSSEYGVFV